MLASGCSCFAFSAAISASSASMVSTAKRVRNLSPTVYSTAIVASECRAHSDRADCRWQHGEPILNHAHAGRPLGHDSECVALRVRLYCAEQLHRAVIHHKIDGRGVCPRFLLGLHPQIISDCGIAALLCSGSLCPAQGVQQVVAAHNARELAAAHHWYALDFPFLEDVDDLAN